MTFHKVVNGGDYSYELLHHEFNVTPSTVIEDNHITFVSTEAAYLMLNQDGSVSYVTYDGTTGAITSEQRLKPSGLSGVPVTIGSITSRSDDTFSDPWIAFSLR